MDARLCPGTYLLPICTLILTHETVNEDELKFTDLSSTSHASRSALGRHGALNACVCLYVRVAHRVYPMRQCCSWGGWVRLRSRICFESLIRCMTVLDRDIITPGSH